MKLSITLLVSLLAVASAACARHPAAASRSSGAELRDAEHVVVSVHKDPATRL